MPVELMSGEGGVNGLVEHASRRNEGGERRHELKEARIQSVARRLAPFLIVAAPSTGCVGRRCRRDERVKTVRSGKRSAMRVTVGSTRSIQAVGHGPSDEKIRCMSTHR